MGGGSGGGGAHVGCEACRVAPCSCTPSLLTSPVDAALTFTMNWGFPEGLKLINSRFDATLKAVFGMKLTVG